MFSPLILHTLSRRSTLLAARSGRATLSPCLSLSIICLLFSIVGCDRGGEEYYEESASDSFYAGSGSEEDASNRDALSSSREAPIDILEAFGSEITKLKSQNLSLKDEIREERRVQQENQERIEEILSQLATRLSNSERGGGAAAPPPAQQDETEGLFDEGY